MTGHKQFEFFILRYMPDVVKGEFVNVGIVMLEPAAGGFRGVRFTRDWRRLRCLDPEADLELLEAVENEVRTRLESDAMDCSKGGIAIPQRDWMLKTIQDSFSGTIQVTPMQAVLAENPNVELAKLAEMYLESQPRARRIQTGRLLIYGRMKEEFERAGVWFLLRKRIAVADYTGKGDPLKIDCGYRPNGVIRLFHAVSLETDIDLAKVLAFTLPGLQEGIVRAEGAKAELDAIVEDGLDRRDDAIAFALATLASAGIGVHPLSELPRLAERARMELKV